LLNRRVIQAISLCSDEFITLIACYRKSIGLLDHQLARGLLQRGSSN
jgi:hypothetical protein